MNFLQLRWLDKSVLRDFGLLLARIVAGTLALHGFHKLTNLPATAGFFANLPLASSAPTLFAVFGGTLQMAVGIFLLIGLFTRWAGVGGVALFLYIIFVVNIPGDGVISPETGGITFEPALMYLTLSLLMFFTGPGRFSLDYLFGARVDK